MNLGIVLVSHSPQIAEGFFDLLSQIAPDVSITIAGGTDTNEIGTNLDKILQAFNENLADEILAFYDLGSAKMNLEMALELTNKKVHLYDVAFIEGAYSATALAQTTANLSEIEAQLATLKIK